MILQQWYYGKADIKKIDIVYKCIIFDQNCLRQRIYDYAYKKSSTS